MAKTVICEGNNVTHALVATCRGHLLRRDIIYLLMVR
jgi:hypothetical protein